jgi:hypothetical protein
MSHQNIDKIPLEDRQKLEQFFGYLIHCSAMGYTLCGEKPVAIEFVQFASEMPVRYCMIFLDGCYFWHILNGWETWVRYSHLFPSENFVFRYIQETKTIVLINKKATIKVIGENIDLFQKFTSSKHTKKEFLDEVCYPKDKDYINFHYGTLLGILLGYGRNNAIAFSNKIYIQKLDSFLPKENFLYGLSAFFPPGFAIINNGTNEKENNKLRKMYKIAEANMVENFKEGSYLDNFIKIYCDPN